MAKVGIVYGSNAGDTKVVAEYIGHSFDSEIIDAKDLTIDFLTKYDKLILVVKLWLLWVLAGLLSILLHFLMV